MKGIRHFPLKFLNTKDKILKTSIERKNERAGRIGGEGGRDGEEGREVVGEEREREKGRKHVQRNRNQNGIALLNTIL